MKKPKVVFVNCPAFETWKHQGRTSEQMWAVENFLTGAGKNLVDKKQLIKEIGGMKKEIGHELKCRMCSPACGFNSACDDIIKLIK